MKIKKKLKGKNYNKGKRLEPEFEKTAKGRWGIPKKCEPIKV